MKKLICAIGFVLYKIKVLCDFFVRKYLSSKFSKIGEKVYIGPNAVFQSTYGKIKIGNHVMFGPGVNIHGGNHKINEIGKLLKHTSEKKMGDDGIVTIEDDCWIGANAIILTNVSKIDVFLFVDVPPSCITTLPFILLLYYSNLLTIVNTFLCLIDKKTTKKHSSFRAVF